MTRRRVVVTGLGMVSPHGIDPAAVFARLDLDWRDHVEHDPALTRPSEILCSLGDPAKAAKVLGWRPTVGFPEIVSRMIRAEHGGVPGADGLATEAGYQPI